MVFADPAFDARMTPTTIAFAAIDAILSE